MARAVILFADTLMASMRCNGSLQERWFIGTSASDADFCKMFTIGRALDGSDDGSICYITPSLDSLKRYMNVTLWVSHCPGSSAPHTAALFSPTPRTISA